MAVPELLRSQYLVDSASYRMRARARTGRKPCERSAIDSRRNGTRVEYDQGYGPWLSCVHADRSSSMQITMATLPLNRTRKRFLFCGFNFRGLPINRENRENWTPRKFPAIRYFSNENSNWYIVAWLMISYSIFCCFSFKRRLQRRN